MPKSGSCEPEGQPAERKRQPAERQSPKRRQRRAVKTTQDERSPSAGRSRETRGRRSSADTPTNTIEKRDCDTLRPSEASQKVFHHSKSGASEGREEAKKNRGSRCHNLGTNRGKPQIQPGRSEKHRKVASFCPPLRSSVHGAGASRAAGVRYQQPHRLTRAREKAIRPHPSADSEQNGVFACLSQQRYLHLQQRSAAVRSSAGFAWGVRRRRGVVHTFLKH